MEEEINFLVLEIMPEDKYAPVWGKDYYQFVPLNKLQKWTWQSIPGDKYLGNLPAQQFMDITVIRMFPSFIERIERGGLKFEMGAAYCTIEDPATNKVIWQKNMGEEKGTWILDTEQPPDE